MLWKYRLEIFQARVEITTAVTLLHGWTVLRAPGPAGFGWVLPDQRGQKNRRWENPTGGFTFKLQPLLLSLVAAKQSADKTTQAARVAHDANDDAGQIAAREQATQGLLKALTLSCGLINFTLGGELVDDDR